MAPRDMEDKVEREKLYTFDEMCQMLQLDRRTLYEWVQYHKIPYVRVNEELVRFRLSDIAQWVKSKNTQPRKKYQIR